MFKRLEATFSNVLWSVLSSEVLCFLTGPPSPEQQQQQQQQQRQPAAVVIESESEEEIDFGYWEKAPVVTGSNGALPKGGMPTGGGASIPASEADKLKTDSPHELDLGLL